jgi:hypothetical protein
MRKWRNWETAGLPSESRDPKGHRRILSLSEGVFVRIYRLIETAATEAIHRGQEHISLALLKDEYDELLPVYSVLSLLLESAGGALCVTPHDNG